MKSMRLGRTELQVSRVGIGGIPLQRPAEAEAVRVVQRALDLGVTFIDTAAGYGPSEERIGLALEGRRQGVVIATKSGQADAAGARQELERSLRRLRTDYIDVWQLHNYSTAERYAQALGPGGALEMAQAARQAGLIRYIGLSSHNPGVAARAIASGLFDTIQYPMNYIALEAADALLPLAEQHDVGVIAMKPFAGGMLSRADLAIKYLLQFDRVIADPGVQSVAEVEELVGVVESGDWALGPEDWAAMARDREALGTRFCRNCEYCMPCPQGVNIPMVMITPKMWKLWPPELFRDPAWWYSAAVLSGKQCAQCGECEARCPFGLPIREMIAEHLAFYERVAAGG